MSIPVQSLLSPDLVSGATNSTGSVDLSSVSTDRRRCRLVVTCTGGTATFKLVTGQTSARTGVVATSTGVGPAGAVLESEMGPWPVLKVEWSSNTGTVTIDAQVWN